MKNRMALVTMMMIAVAAAPAMGLFRRKKHAPDAALCGLRTVYVSGNSEAAVIARKKIGKLTWLRLVSDKSKADSVLELSDRKSVREFPLPMATDTVSAELKRGTKLLWSGSAHFDEGPLNSGAGSATKIVLDELNRAASCGK